MTKFILILLVPLCLFAGTYWVDDNGAATWANAESATPLEGTNCTTYALANTNADAGDTVYYRAGTYTISSGNAIDPTNTGTAGNMIVFMAYNSENVIFDYTGSTATDYAIDLNSDTGTIRSYIKVHGITFLNFPKHLWILRGKYNEISYCTLTGFPSAFDGDDIGGIWSASYIYRKAQYNWIHNCVFGNWGACEPFGYDKGVVFQVGLETSTTDSTRFNLVEYDTMYHGGHHVISFNGSYNIYRYGYYYNDPWCPSVDSTFSTRTMFQTGTSVDGRYNLVHGNRIGYGGPKNKDEIGGAGGTLAGAHNIWRRNEFVNIYTDAMWVTKYSGQTTVDSNKVYNNIYFGGGYGSYQWNPGGDDPSPYWNWSYTHAVCMSEGATTVFDNVWKNNIFCSNKNYYGDNLSFINITTHAAPTLQEISNNWIDAYGYPLFVDTVGTADPTDPGEYDFNLQSESACIDSGAWLTTITTANGSGTSFVVADAGYFCDGFGIGDSISTSGVTGDTIQFDGISTYSVITDINYSTNTITVDRSVTWTQNLGVGLKYSGDKMDLGAYEYIETGGTPASVKKLDLILVE